MRRPRGQRRTPTARARAPRDPYGALHRKIRRVLLAELAAMGSAPCPICQQPMTVAMRLHLHHSNAASKLAGLPGDQLAHARCNVADGGRLGASITNRATVTPIKPSRQSRAW
jgi:hypothetical protein